MVALGKEAVSCERGTSVQQATPSVIALFLQISQPTLLQNPAETACVLWGTEPSGSYLSLIDL